MFSFFKILAKYQESLAKYIDRIPKQGRLET